MATPKPIPAYPEIIADGPFRGLHRNAYRAIYADPPWTFETRSDEGKDRSAEQHYSCMSISDLNRLPVSELAAKDCVLFLWVTDTHLEQALTMARAWGFTYKTKAFCWVKVNKDADRYLVTDDRAYFKGMGYWTRANPEDCLLLTRGQPPRAASEGPAASVRRLLVSERREHSRKPEEVYDRIETLVPGPYLELFARTQRAGWQAWGNEIGKFDPPKPRHRLL